LTNVGGGGAPAAAGVAAPAAGGAAEEAPKEEKKEEAKEESDDDMVSRCHRIFGSTGNITNSPRASVSSTKRFVVHLPNPKNPSGRACLVLIVLREIMQLTSQHGDQ
jgi:hypothetical protein